MKSSFAPLPATLLISILLILALFSCKKDPYELGIDLLPPSDTLNVLTTDTCTVEAFSVRVDSIRTDGGPLIIGGMYDPVFGKTTSSLYTQTNLSSLAPDFGTNPILDSLILVLYYNDYYGDTSTVQNIKVWEVSEDIEPDSSYYSNKRMNTYPTLLANHTFIPHPTDSVMVDTIRKPAQLRINLSKLTSYLGNKILQAPASALASNSAFIDFMKGLYIQASPVNNGGALLNFTLGDETSQLVVYFHDGDAPANDSLNFPMLINTSCKHFLHIDHNNYLDANQDLKRQILSHDSAQGANQLFLQGLAGVKIKLKLPYLASFANGQAVINDALITFKNAETDTTFGPPPSLTVVRQDSAGRIAYLIDYNEGDAYFGGTYDQEKGTYFFRITRYMQKVMANYYTNKYDLFILVNNPLSTALYPNRVILNGTNPLVPGTDEGKFKLTVTYTLLK